MRFFAAILSISIGLVFLPGVSQAHKVNLFAYQEAGTVFTESYFGDGTPCRNAMITANDESGIVIAEGVTDGEGTFSFQWEKSGELRIILRASMGHGDEIILWTHEMDDVNQSREASEGTDLASKGGSVSQINPTISEDAVSRIVESKIAPLRDSLREIRKKLEKPTFGKVVGGLGWIIGIAGAYLWGASRRKGRKG